MSPRRPAGWRTTTSRPRKQGIRFHDLPYTAVALATATGTNVKVIRTRLGHASIKVTLDVYGHMLPGEDDAATE